jgi:hypothetical protein
VGRGGTDSILYGESAPPARKQRAHQGVFAAGVEVLWRPAPGDGPGGLEGPFPARVLGRYDDGEISGFEIEIESDRYVPGPFAANATELEPLAARKGSESWRAGDEAQWLMQPGCPVDVRIAELHPSAPRARILYEDDEGTPDQWGADGGWVELSSLTPPQ